MKSRGKAFLLFPLLALLLGATSLSAAALPLIAGQALPAGWAGPLRLTLRLPPDRARAQPLLAIGNPEHGALLFWLGDGGGQARLGLEMTGEGVAFSPAFAAAEGEAHVIDLSWGAVGLAAAAGSADLSATLRGLFCVVVDGRFLMARRQAEAPRAEQVFFGANLIGSGLCRPFFTGTAARLETGEALPLETEGSRLVNLLPQRSLLPGGYPGPLRLRLRLPPGTPGRIDPLLVAGRSGEDGLWYLRYEDPSHFRIGFSAWGFPGPLSEPISFQPGIPYDLRLSGSLLYPPVKSPPQAGDSAAALLPAVLWAEWAGRPVLATLTRCPQVPPAQIFLGAHLAGGRLAAPGFGGEIDAVEPLEPAAVAPAAMAAVFPRVPAPSPAWQGFPGRVRLHVVFPQVWPSGEGEPLVVAGTTGAADMVYVTYEADGRVRFGMDRWGSASLSSDSLALAPGSEHEVTVGLGALLPPPGSPVYARQPELAAHRDEVRIELDGRTILAGRRSPNRVEPGQIEYGVNLAGGSTSGPAFTGRILQLEAVPWPAGPSVR